MKICKELKKARDEKVKQYKKIMKKINGMPIDDEAKEDFAQFMINYINKFGGLE